MSSLEPILNSSLQPWLDLSNSLRFENLFQLDYDFPPCEILRLEDESTSIISSAKTGFPIGLEVVIPANNSCQEVCAEYLALSDPRRPVNLLNCGLWAKLASIWLRKSNLPFNVPERNGTRPMEPPDLEDPLQEFASQGLDYRNESYLNIVTGAVSSMLASFPNLKGSERYVLGPTACSEAELFPFEGSTIRPIGSGLWPCLNILCASSTLNPDLGGIGVYISLILQLALVLTAYLALLITGPTPSKYSKKFRRHAPTLVTAMTELQKSQCYFASALNIASIVAHAIGYDGRDYFIVIIPLALNGFVPVIFGMLVVSHYGRLSWHIMILTTLTVALSTWPLQSAYRAWQDITQPTIMTASRLNYAVQKQVCGSRANEISFLEHNIIQSPAVWLIFSHCVACLVFNISWHTLYHAPRFISRTRTIHKFSKWVTETTQKPTPPWRMLALCLFLMFLALWFFCYAYLLYLYHLLRVKKFVAQGWGFGQVVAIMAWVPTIVEFLYMEKLGIEEASKYRYPPGWQVVNTLVRPTAGFGNLETFQLVEATSRSRSATIAKIKAHDAGTAQETGEGSQEV